MHYICCLLLQVLLDELADPKVRGVMCCLGFVFMSLGIFMVSFLGVMLSWQVVAAIGCIIAAFCFLTSCMVAESPIWLARNGKVKAAEKALNWIWGPNREAEVCKKNTMYEIHVLEYQIRLGSVLFLIYSYKMGEI